MPSLPLHRKWTKPQKRSKKGRSGLILASKVPDNLGGNLKFWFDPIYIEAKEAKENAGDIAAKGDVGDNATKENAADSPAKENAGDDMAQSDLICQGVRRILWQKSPSSGGRFVVAQFPMNWQGDWYGLYLVDAKMPPNKLQDFVTGLIERSQTEMQEVPGATLIYHNLWHQPFLFHNSKTNQIVAVDTKTAWLSGTKFFPDWAVYVAAGGARVKRIGTITFTPTARAVDLLPKGALRELADVLDKIIGTPSQSEGTFQATPRLRGEAQIAWGNLMLRPWALAAPKNSREDVELGLKRWQKGSPVYKQQYQQLHHLYPQALESLTSYYQRHFNKSFNAAHELAVKSLDIAYRSNFKF